VTTNSAIDNYRFAAANLQSAIENYQSAVANLQVVYDKKGARACAAASGDVFENLIDDLISLNPDYKSLKNDYLTVELDGNVMDNVQVDRHIRRVSDNCLRAVIESKTYLDSPFCKRAVVDFIEVCSSNQVDANTQLVVFAGQSCISQKTLNYYQAFCKKYTGRNFNLFLVNEEKKRNSKKPIYKHKFTLDEQEIVRFNNFINSL